MLSFVLYFAWKDPRFPCSLCTIGPVDTAVQVGRGRGIHVPTPANQRPARRSEKQSRERNEQQLTIAIHRLKLEPKRSVAPNMAKIIEHAAQRVEKMVYPGSGTQCPCTSGKCNTSKKRCCSRNGRGYKVAQQSESKSGPMPSLAWLHTF